jgi:hypothetical protein
MSNLHLAAHNDRILRDELLRRFPSLADDEQTLLDTLDGESDFDRQVLAVLRSADHDDMLAAGIESRLDELQGRKARLAERVTQKRSAILAAMQMAGRKKVELPDATVSVRATPAKVIITDEALVPPGYFEPQAPRLSKTAVKAALDEGTEVPGAMMSNGGVTLSIRKG